MFGRNRKRLSETSELSLGIFARWISLPYHLIPTLESCDPSGEFLIRGRGEREDIGGVVRRSSSKYSSPATGDLYSRVTTLAEEVEVAIRQVDAKGRALIAIRVELVNEEDQVVAGFEFTWMISSLEISKGVR